MTFWQPLTIQYLFSQQLVDCDILDAGCNGNFPMAAYEAIKILGDIRSKEGYPYAGEQETYHLEPREFAADVNRTVCMSHNQEDVAAWMPNNGAVSLMFNLAALRVGQSSD